MYLLLIILLSFSLFFCSGERSVQQEEPEDCIAMENQTALVMDFYNASGNPEYDNISAEVANRLYRTLNIHFLMNDPVDVRNYLENQNLSDEALSEYHTAIQVGEYFQRNVVIFGSYNVIGDEITFTIEMRSLTDNIMNQHVVTCDLGSSCIDVLCEESFEIAKSSFPPICIHPPPPPEWISNPPSSTQDTFYFLGEARDIEDYNRAVLQAFDNGYEKISYTIGTKVESVFTELLTTTEIAGADTVVREVSQSLSVKTSSTVRGATESDRYFEVSEEDYDVWVLLEISKENLQAAIEESIQREQEKIKIALLKAEQELAEAEAIRFRAQLALLEALNNKVSQIVQITPPDIESIYSEQERMYAELGIQIEWEDQISVEEALEFINQVIQKYNQNQCYQFTVYRYENIDSDPDDDFEKELIKGKHRTDPLALYAHYLSSTVSARDDAQFLFPDPTGECDTGEMRTNVFGAQCVDVTGYYETYYARHPLREYYMSNMLDAIKQDLIMAQRNPDHQVMITQSEATTITLGGGEVESYPIPRQTLEAIKISIIVPPQYVKPAEETFYMNRGEKYYGARVIIWFNADNLLPVKFNAWDKNYTEVEGYTWIHFGPTECTDMDFNPNNPAYDF